MIRLKGVFKSDGTYWKFAEWAKRTNNVNIYPESGTYKVNVAYKVGKKKKLKSCTVTIHVSNCECCRGSIDMRGMPG